MAAIVARRRNEGKGRSRMTVVQDRHDRAGHCEP
jgi:3'-phosphoadenosine 5'-phosphosulfate sulfotransferase (PAPS reductase)/FAD synthetase